MNEIQIKRRVHAQILMCDGCCCGRVENGHRAVPTEAMKQQWRAHKLGFEVDLTTPYCLGPCDAANVVCIMGAAGSRWFGRLQKEHYALLLEWAKACKTAQRALPLPPQFDALEFDRWRESAPHEEKSS